MLTPTREWGLAALLLAVAVAALVVGTEETTPYSFLFDPAKAETDEQRFLQAAIQEFGVTRAELDPLMPRLRRMGPDIPVLLYTAREAKKPLGEVVEARRSSSDWIEARRKLGLPLKPLFQGVTGRMEAYKDAWTEWRMKYRPELTDEQVRELVLLQLAHEMTGRPVADLADERAAGQRLDTMVARHIQRERVRAERAAARAALSGERAASPSPSPSPSAKASSSSKGSSAGKRSRARPARLRSER